MDARLRSELIHVLGADAARVDELLAAARRAGIEDAAPAALWLSIRDPQFYLGSRGPRPLDPLLHALHAEARRQAPGLGYAETETETETGAGFGLIEAVIGTRRRREGTRPRRERRAAAWRAAALAAGQSGFSGFNWGTAEGAP